MLFAQLTSLPDLPAHKLHRTPDAGAVCNIHQEGLQSGGGCCPQICCAFFRETRSDDLEAFSGQLSGQKVAKAAVTACDEHVLLSETIKLVGISDEPADDKEGGQKKNAG